MTRKEVLAEGVELYLGDCREIVPALSGINAVVSDPPYGIGYSHMFVEPPKPAKQEALEL